MGTSYWPAWKFRPRESFRQGRRRKLPSRPFLGWYERTHTVAFVKRGTLIEIVILAERRYHLQQVDLEQPASRHDRRPSLRLLRRPADSG